MAKGPIEKEKRKRPRTCVGCGEESPKRALFRVVRTPEGEVRLDPTGRAPGRGAYVCLRKSCVLAARKKKALTRFLRAQVSPEIYERLLELCPGEDEE